MMINTNPEANIGSDISQVINLLSLAQKCQLEKNEAECILQIDQAKKVRSLLNNEIVRSDLIERKIRHQLTGERYNIFDVLNRSSHEGSHSLFLRHLLDPRATHDQGSVFLNSFIQVLLKLANEQDIKIGNDWPSDWSSALTKTEVAHENGRLDIVIEIPHVAYIIIENKVWASEQKDQLARYGLELEKKIKTHKYRALIFLTPTGYKSDTKGAYSVVNMSYEHLTQCLGNAMKLVKPTAIPVISTIQQYIEQCIRIYKGENFMTYMNEEIINLLKESSNFEVAQNICMHFAELERRMKNDFIVNVRKILKNKLSDINSGWRVMDVDRWSGGTISIEFDSNNLGVLYGSMFHPNPGKRQCGWFDPRGEIKHDDREIIDLVNEMKIEYPIEKHNMWLCCITGNAAKKNIPTIDLSERDLETKRMIIADNENIDHPKAKEVADAMFSLFDKYREKIEKLALFRDRCNSANAASQNN